ncbi:hypothetical protein MTO96_032652 [Rhipicephalus appendiculatus]
MQGVHGNYADDVLLANAFFGSGPTGCPQQRRGRWFQFTSSQSGGRQDLRCSARRSCHGTYEFYKRPFTSTLAGRGRQANAKKRGCARPPSLQKEALHSASNEENKNLRFLLRVVADLLPPDSQQLRSICLQAGGALLPSSKHG